MTCLLERKLSWELLDNRQLVQAQNDAASGAAIITSLALPWSPALCMPDCGGGQMSRPLDALDKNPMSHPNCESAVAGDVDNEGSLQQHVTTSELVPIPD